MTEAVSTQIHLSELSLDQLISLNQSFGREIDRLREQRMVVKQYIAGHLHAQLPPSDQGDAVAPGAELTVVSQG